MEAIEKSSTSSSMEDRISSLPDNLLHHIFSFLDTKYAVQSSTLSIRWRYLWRSLQILNFDWQSFINTSTPFHLPNLPKLKKFANKVLTLRDKNSSIRTFSLNLIYLYPNDFTNPIPHQLTLWLGHIVQYNVQQVHLTGSHLVDSETLRRSSGTLFMCKTLQILKLTFFVHDQLHLPDSVNLPNLRILEVRSICFVVGDFAVKLFSGSPLLESLFVEDMDLFDIEVTIDAPNLKYLSLKFGFEQDLRPYVKVTINALKLESFKCEDSVIAEYHIHYCSSLDKAYMDITIKEELAEKKKVYGERVIRCLQGFSIAKDLTLSASLLEFVSETHSVLERLPTELSNLQRLKLVACLSSDCILAIIHFLKISPNIETLVLELTECPQSKHHISLYSTEEDFHSENAVEYEAARLPLQHLKFVEMRGVLGCINELKFMEILLKTAVVIDKMVVFTSKNQSSDEERMIKFLEKLLSFPRATSNVAFPDREEIENSMEDRISRLPDNLLHHIFSFLDTKYAVQSSILSFRWRYLWKSIQVLNLDWQAFVNPSTSFHMPKIAKFVKFTHKVLTLRDTNSDIHTCCINLDYIDHGLTNLIPHQLPSWIDHIVQCNVQQLHLTRNSLGLVNLVTLEGLPRSLFTCETLQILKLKFQVYDLIHLPDAVSLPNLRVLEVRSIGLLIGESGVKLFSGSPLLESLSVRDMDLYLDAIEVNIDSPNLKYLALKFGFQQYARPYVKVNINAPKLELFKCEDSVVADYHIQNCSLDKGFLDITIKEMDYYVWSLEELAEKKKVYGEHIIRCLQGVSRAKDLTLSASLLEFLSETPTVLENLPTEFCNLRRLKLLTCLSSDCILAIMKFLMISSNIETLVLELTECPQSKLEINPYLKEGDFHSENIVEYQEARFPLQHLKFVKIGGVLGCINELKFMEILLETALGIEKMVVFTSESQSPEGERMIKFREKLLSFPRAASSVVFLGSYLHLPPSF